ncbi:hypothetical protein FGRA07_11771 [Fusarium graminearum]|uniref:Uncharacterized protein n=1 Tax=Gibberella zeae TaxID=5518 RepID=A0A2H3FNR1_GIBZA|nr:hypothetical protein FGRA07_11771 [Fusarium graminearum]
MSHTPSSDSESSAKSRVIDSKKKRRRKKSRLSSQAAINSIWKLFSTSPPQQALSILPLDPATKLAPDSNHGNELLSKSRLRVVAECRRQVSEIVKECKQLNMRYRDRGWDLAFDLPDQGYCLNGLRNTRFDVNQVSHLDAESKSPGAVKRVHEIFQRPTFMMNVDGTDVKQGKLSDCWFVAGLTALANLQCWPDHICAAHDTDIGVYGFVFYRDGMWTHTIIDDTLYLQSPSWDSPSLQRTLLQQTGRADAEKEFETTYQTGSRALFFAQCKDQNETWVPLIEKAYAKAHGDYAALEGGWIGEGLEDLSGGVTTELFTSDILDPDVFWDTELSKVNQEFLFGASTGFLDGGFGERDGISEGHAYILLAAHILESGQRLLKLRNPWAHSRKGIWEGPWSDGSKEWTPEVQQELKHGFGTDSVFWISFKDFMRKFSHLDRTRLFREPDWRCSQSWISVDVPWRACYQERFRVVLSKESPVVVAVSQLDRRYFNGLHGQYSFRLSFRIDHHSSSGVRRCVAQSHGNYLMTRSAAIEVPTLIPGAYSVCVRISAERDCELESVEEVVKQECKARTENVKLAQVGFAHDVAHSKAEPYINGRNRLHKKKKQESASNCRKGARRRRWEQRRVEREVERKQERKNDVKRQALRESHEQADKVKGSIAERDKHPVTGRGSIQAVAKTAAHRLVDVENTEQVVLHQGQAGTCDGKAGKSVCEEKSSTDVTTMKCSAKNSRPFFKHHEPGDSSDSPIDDWERLYSSDDASHSIRSELGNTLRRKTRCAHGTSEDMGRESAESEDSDGNQIPTPWSAVCVVGIRVYSKDEELRLETIFGDSDVSAAK